MLALEEAVTGDVLERRVNKNIAIFTGKNLYWSLFLIKLLAPALQRY